MNEDIKVLRLVVRLWLIVAWVGVSQNSEAWGQEFSTLHPNHVADENKQIRRILTRQSEAWNQGDLEQFMKAYWKSPLLTFSAGGNTTRGWDATLERYRKSYAPPKEMGKLSFDELEVTLLESKTAMVLGRWHLEMSREEHREGNFSLVLHRIDDQWRIIHDHSSSLEPIPAEPNGDWPAPAPESDSKDSLQQRSSEKQLHN